MTDGPHHFCPGCGSRQRRFDRYPWYFCQACLASAEDGEGRRLSFGNASIGGGFVWAYADNPGLCDDTASMVVCLIGERPVTVTEARFGGIVAEPGSSTQRPRAQSSDVADLIRQMKSGRERLKERSVE